MHNNMSEWAPILYSSRYCAQICGWYSAICTMWFCSPHLISPGNMTQIAKDFAVFRSMRFQLTDDATVPKLSLCLLIMVWFAALLHVVYKKNALALTYRLIIRIHDCSCNLILNPPHNTLSVEASI